jgi:hypothetical protein
MRGSVKHLVSSGDLRGGGRRRARLVVVLVLSTLAFGIESVAVTASASPTASIAKKCKKGKNGKACRKKKATKPVKAKISLTNCPTADLTPNVLYTFTGRVVPAIPGMAIVIQYFDQGTAPLARHTVTTAQNGSFSDSYAYPATGIRRGGTVRANSTTAIDPVCNVTIAEM